MILRKSVHLLAAFLFLAILVAPLGTSASVGASQTSDVAGRATAQQDAAPVEPPTDQIIVKYKKPASMDGAISPASALAMQRLSATAGVPLTYVREMSGDAYVLGLPSPMPLAEVQAMADRMSALPEVEYTEPDAIMQHTLEPNDPLYGNQWHYFAPGADHYGINAPAAWNITTGSPGIVVAVIDTGITNHADLAGRSVPGLGYDFITNVASANDGNGRDSNPSDPGDWVAANECYAGSSPRNSSWHGTHVAGTIGAASNNSTGVAGINWSSKILSARVLGKCGGTISDIADGMRWSAGLPVPGVPPNTNKAKVLNLSLGGFGACDATYQNAIDEILAAGTTVVVAAGNNYGDDANKYRPANCNGVITVAATNRNGSLASYSNKGAVVEISAPGGETSPTSSNGVLSTLNTGTQGPAADAYVYYQGTSMATPHVAGVASLLYSRNPSLTPAQVLSLLQSTVTHFPGGSTCNTSNCGSGIVNAGAAVAAVPNAPNLNKKLYLPLVQKGLTPSFGWTTMVSTDFEGTWPSPWVVYDDNGTAGGVYYWGKRNCRAYSGSYSGWAMGAGAQGAASGCGANYPDNAVSWMRYGPFSLSDTTAADLKFKLWLNSELNYDKVCRFASIDGTNYWGTCTSGNTGGWTDRVLDLSNVFTLGNLLGRPSVWIALVFYSDSDTNYSEGGYVDNIVLRKCPSGGTCPAVLLQTPLSDNPVIETSEHIVSPR